MDSSPVPARADGCGRGARPTPLLDQLRRVQAQVESSKRSPGQPMELTYSLGRPMRWASARSLTAYSELCSSGDGSSGRL